jgi:membrane fusion protein, epimerase transport system
MKTLSLVPLRVEPMPNELARFTSTSSTSMVILAIITVVIGGLGIWSSTVKIASGAVAEGSIVVESRRKTIQHLEGGIVSEVLVHDGDFVKADQILLRLSDARSKLTYATLQDKDDQDRAMASRLVAERDDLDDVKFDQDILDRSKADTATAAIITQQLQQFSARRKAEQGKDELLNRKIDELKQQIAGLKAQVASKDTEIKLFADELNGAEYLFAKGLEPKTRVLALERASQDVIGTRAENLAQIDATEVAIGGAEMEILQNQRSFHEDVLEKLREVTADELDTRDRMASLKETMDRLVVRSPIDGQVVGSIVHTVGGVVNPGEKLMEIVPDADPLVVDAHIPPNEIDHVAAGQDAEVRLTALRQRTAPTLNGTVSTVSTDVLFDSETHAPYYSARVEIPSQELRRLGGEKLIAGMPAEVLLKNGDRTVIGYIFAPITDAIFRSFRRN